MIVVVDDDDDDDDDDYVRSRDRVLIAISVTLGTVLGAVA